MTTTTTRSRAGECSIVTTERQLTAVVKVHTPTNKLPQAERSSRAKLNAALPSLNVGPLGRSFTLWRPTNPGFLDMEPGIVVSRVFAPLGDIVASSLPGGRAAHFLLIGPYDGLPGGWNTLLGWCAGQRLELAGINWQLYQEENADPAKIATALYALLA